MQTAIALSVLISARFSKRSSADATCATYRLRNVVTCRRVPDIELARSSHTDEVYAVHLIVCKPINCTHRYLHAFYARELHMM